MGENQRRAEIRAIAFEGVWTQRAAAALEAGLPHLFGMGRFGDFPWPAGPFGGSIPLETRAQSARPQEQRAGSSGASQAMAADRSEDETARALLDRLEPDDPEAFAELFALYRADLTKLCRRLLFDASSVDDVLSEIFLRAHRAFPQFDRDKPFRPWLRAVATNHCIDRLRRDRTEQGIFEAGDFAVETAADQAPDALLGITQREERAAVLAALDALPTKFRVPLVLRFYKDLDYDAIASILGTTRNQVGTLLFRAKARLRNEILSRSADDTMTQEMAQEMSQEMTREMTQGRAKREGKR